MSLEQLQVKNIFQPVLAVGFINFALMVLLLIISTTIFARPSGVEMEFPSYTNGMDVSSQALVITITSENVIYVDNRVVTLNQLRHFLRQGNYRRDAIMIKVDRRASMGRVADILNLCRGIIGANVSVSTIL